MSDSDDYDPFAEDEIRDNEREKQKQQEQEAFQKQQQQQQNVSGTQSRSRLVVVNNGQSNNNHATSTTMMKPAQQSLHLSNNTQQNQKLINFIPEDYLFRLHYQGGHLHLLSQYHQHYLFVSSTAPNASTCPLFLFDIREIARGVSMRTTLNNNAATSTTTNMNDSNIVMRHPLATTTGFYPLAAKPIIRREFFERESTGVSSKTQHFPVTSMTVMLPPSNEVVGTGSSSSCSSSIYQRSIFSSSSNPSDEENSSSLFFAVAGGGPSFKIVRMFDSSSSSSSQAQTQTKNTKQSATSSSAQQQTATSNSSSISTEVVTESPFSTQIGTMTPEQHQGHSGNITSLSSFFSNLTNFTSSNSSSSSSSFTLKSNDNQIVSTATDGCIRLWNFSSGSSSSTTNSLTQTYVARHGLENSSSNSNERVLFQRECNIIGGSCSFSSSSSSSSTSSSVLSSLLWTAGLSDGAVLFFDPRTKYRAGHPQSYFWTKKSAESNNNNSMFKLHNAIPIPGSHFFAVRGTNSVRVYDLRVTSSSTNNNNSPLPLLEFSDNLRLSSPQSASPICSGFYDPNGRSLICSFDASAEEDDDFLDGIAVCSLSTGKVVHRASLLPPTQNRLYSQTHNPQMMKEKRIPPPALIHCINNMQNGVVVCSCSDGALRFAAVSRTKIQKEVEESEPWINYVPRAAATTPSGSSSSGGNVLPERRDRY